jgi:2',3'-cyclic-nucleotide 2'-phosphodiesterase (5'-nucleotidase family)
MDTNRRKLSYGRMAVTEAAPHQSNSVGKNVMRGIWRTALCAGALGVALLPAAAQKCAAAEAHLSSQAAADVLRDATGADGAFLAAGLVRETFQRDNLASLLQYPEDEIVVVALKGSLIRQAFERSLSLYPQQNTSFLQLSGFEVAFDPSGAPGSRIKRVSASGGALDDNRVYNVAMPSSLGRGGLGYFKIWDKSKIVSTLENATVEKILAGKRFSETSPRWVVER